MTETQLEFSDVLDHCIEDVKAGRLTIEECLDQYPEFAHELREPLVVAEMLGGIPLQEPSESFRQQARPRLMAQLGPMPDGRVSLLEKIQQKWTHFFIIPQTRRLSMGWMLALFLVASVLVGGGTAYASDNAVPGQPLYGLDRSLEEIQADLTVDPQAFVALQLAFADERLSEAQELASEEEGEGFQEALNGYGESIGAVVQKFAAAEAVDLEALESLLDDALTDHDAKLAALALLDEDDVEDDCDIDGEEDCEENENEENGDLDDDIDDGDKSENRFCVTGESHPVALKLEGDYTAEEIMEWFCGSEDSRGVGFGQIMHAIQTEALLVMKGETITADELLAMKADGFGWGLIWQQYGLKGKPTIVEDPEDGEQLDDVSRPEPPGQAKKAGQPESPGQAKKADRQEAPGQVQRSGRQEPPGQAKKSEQQEPSDEAGDIDRPDPPGQSEKSDNPEPPGQAKKSGQQEPPGKAKKSDQPEPPGQAKKSGQQEPPGQAKKSDQNGGKKNKDK